MLKHWIKDLKGNEYPIEFNQGVFERLAIDEDIPINQSQAFFADIASWGMKRLYKLYHLAFKISCKSEGIKFYDDFDDFLDWFTGDQTLNAQLAKVWKAAMPDPNEQKKPVRKIK